MSDTTDGQEGPFDPDAEIRPDLIQVTPDPAAPGQVVELTFAEGTSRGLSFIFEHLSDSGWNALYILSSDRGPDLPDGMSSPDPAQPGWQPLGDEFFQLSLGFSDAGPDRVTIPDVAEPGTWRICTTGKPVTCTQIEVRTQR